MHTHAIKHTKLRSKVAPFEPAFTVRSNRFKSATFRRKGGWFNKPIGSTCPSLPYITHNGLLQIFWEHKVRYFTPK